MLNSNCRDRLAVAIVTLPVMFVIAQYVFAQAGNPFTQATQATQEAGARQD